MIKNYKFLILNLVVFVTFFSFTSFAATYQAVILKISDGDTVWVKMHGKRVKLRLLGIDTPEEYPSRKMDKDIEMCHTTKANTQRKLLVKPGLRIKNTEMGRGNTILKKYDEAQRKIDKPIRRLKGAWCSFGSKVLFSLSSKVNYSSLMEVYRTLSEGLRVSDRGREDE